MPVAIDLAKDGRSLQLSRAGPLYSGVEWSKRHWGLRAEAGRAAGPNPWDEYYRHRVDAPETTVSRSRVRATLEDWRAGETVMSGRPTAVSIERPGSAASY